MTAAIRIIPLKFASHHDSFFLQTYDDRSPREKAAETFLDLLTLNVMRDDAPEFDLG